MKGWPREKDEDEEKVMSANVASAKGEIISTRNSCWVRAGRRVKRDMALPEPLERAQLNLDFR